MSNELVQSALERANSVLSSHLMLLLADRAVLGAHPAIYDAGDVAGIGNNVIKVPRAGLDGYALMATATEIQDLGNTAYVDASTNVTVGKYYLAHAMSGSVLGTDMHLSAARMGQSLAVSAMVTETSLAASLATSFSVTAGAVTAEMSLTTSLSALSMLEAANVPGPYLMIGHSSHIRGLRLEQLLGVAGQAQYQAPVGVAAGTGYKGTLWGVGLFQSNYAPASGAGKAGLMAGFGAILRAQMTAPVIEPARQVASGNVRIAYSFDDGTDVGKFAGTLYVGYALNDDTRAVQILAKA